VVYLDAWSPSQRRFNIASPRGEWQRQLIQDFPQEKEAIDQFFNVADEIKILQWLAIVKVLPLWLVRMCHRVGLFRFFSPFFALNEMGTLNDVVKVMK